MRVALRYPAFFAFCIIQWKYLCWEAAFCSSAAQRLARFGTISNLSNWVRAVVDYCSIVLGLSHFVAVMFIFSVMPYQLGFKKCCLDTGFSCHPAHLFNFSLLKLLILLRTNFVIFFPIRVLFASKRRFIRCRVMNTAVFR